MSEGTSGGEGAVATSQTQATSTPASKAHSNGNGATASERPSPSGGPQAPQGEAKTTGPGQWGDADEKAFFELAKRSPYRAKIKGEERAIDSPESLRELLNHAQRGIGASKVVEQAKKEMESARQAREEALAHRQLLERASRGDFEARRALGLVTGEELQAKEREWAEVPPGSPPTWTDEAALLEACRIPVHAIPGESTNLKVTLPDDLDRVEAALVARGVLAQAPPAVRVGFGDDGHPFGPGRPLALGGLVIADAPALHGHSDGDVALHAVCDALLGAAGLGDLGRHFPAGPATPAGVASRELLTTCVARVRAAGYAPVSLDLTLIGARPRLAGRLDAMAAAVAEIIGLPADRVNVKASTGNLAGFEGAGRGISARAVAVVAASPAGPSAQPVRGAST